MQSILAEISGPPFLGIRIFGIFWVKPFCGKMIFELHSPRTSFLVRHRPFKCGRINELWNNQSWKRFLNDNKNVRLRSLVVKYLRSWFHIFEKKNENACLRHLEFLSLSAVTVYIRINRYDCIVLYGADW